MRLSSVLRALSGGGEISSEEKEILVRKQEWEVLVRRGPAGALQLLQGRWGRLPLAVSVLRPLDPGGGAALGLAHCHDVRPRCPRSALLVASSPVAWAVGCVWSWSIFVGTSSSVCSGGSGGWVGALQTRFECMCVPCPQTRVCA
jgi:hypothetical protein